MEKNQKINCSVESCGYNNKGSNECTLKQIDIEPVYEMETGEPDESMCSNYKYTSEQ